MSKLAVLNNRPPWRAIGVRAYRLAVLVIIVLLMRDLADWQRIQGDKPITLREVRQIMPEAASLDVDTGPRAGLFVYDDSDEQIGYAVRTQPQAREIIGYSGPTDTLFVFNDAMKIVGYRIRSSPDTHEHVEDVKENEYFQGAFDGIAWDELPGINPYIAGLEGVSGATLTSMAITDGIIHRVAVTKDKDTAPPGIRFAARDIGLIIVIGAACLLCFTHLRGKLWLRRTFQVIVIGYVGFYNGDLIAQALLLGWAESGVAWRIAPGLALLAAASLVIPWTTRRPIYCGHICPHGAAQELIGKVVPWRIRVPRGVSEKLKWIAPLLLALVIFTTMMNLSLNPAAIEPFDAYLIQTAGWATIIVAIVGLIAAAFIPQAYCKYGCPTGSLLEFVRSHGHAGKLAKRDAVAAALVAFTACLYFFHDPIVGLITHPSAPW